VNSASRTPATNLTQIRRLNEERRRLGNAGTEGRFSSL
jgi:hypothetical protein